MKPLNDFLIESKSYQKGETIKVYHGNSKKINKVDTSANKSGSDFGSGAYFTTNIETAKSYGEFVYEAEIKLKNPVILENRSEMNDIWDYMIVEKENGSIPKDIEMKEYIISKGADGIVIHNPIMGMKSNEIWFVVYYNKQVNKLTKLI